jgi:Na+/proline symporter/signal transduction histidine kinase
MSFELGHLFFAALIYLLVLFFIAYATEQGWISQRVARHPVTYALSLGVYATSWTFYGSVGFAQTQGFNFLSIYVGVTLAFMLAPVLLAPILRITRDYQLTSLADVLSFRYRSQTAGVLVTLFMLFGALPYIALQILAVTESIQILTQEAAPQVLALGFCVTLTLFAILFGARHISPREKHEGLVVAIAFESVIKLVALCAVGVFALFGVFGGFGGLDDWLAVNPQALEALYRPVREGPWTTLLLLSFCAAFLLPRQFHMAFAENIEERTLWSASWIFPLFLLLLNLFIPTILWAGMELRAATNADFYVLGITLGAEHRALTALAFIGGISAASAMMIVTSLALASMCLNHLLLPASYPDPVAAGYGFYLVLERNQGLVQLGLISFVAMAQFLPGVFGLLFWPRATRAGFIAGLLGGGVVWTLTLLFPLLQSSGIGGDLLAMLSMPAGPERDPWTYATLSSLAVNGLLFFGVSLLAQPSDEEREAADACCRTTFTLPGGAIVTASSPGEFKERLARILGEQAAGFEVDQALKDLNMGYEERGSRALRQLRERIERNLSGLMGPMLARMIVDERLQTDSGARTALADNIRFIEERMETSQMRFEGAAAALDRLRRYHQQTLRDLPLGVCALGPDREVLTWNLAMEVISGVDRGQSRGLTVDQLPSPWGRLMLSCVESDEQHLHKIETAVSGRRRWFNLHKAAIENPTAPGEAGGVVILVEDLTDLQNLESELTHSERLASIGRLAAGVAHEIGNPVTGIACLAQNLESETDDGETRATSRQIIDQTKRISEIVQTLVGFSHGGSFASERPQLLPLSECIREAADLVGMSHGATAVDIRIDCPTDILLTADRTRLIQVFVNLLTNACDASRPGDEVLVQARVVDGNGVIEVIDDGEGMAEDLLDQVFEPFVTTKGPRHGTGLGLSVVYRIVEDHGGQIAIDSRPGQGTRVVLTFPDAQRAEAAPREAPAARKGGLA